MRYIEDEYGSRLMFSGTDLPEGFYECENMAGVVVDPGHCHTISWGDHTHRPLADSIPKMSPHLGTIRYNVVAINAAPRDPSVVALDWVRNIGEEQVEDVLDFQDDLWDDAWANDEVRDIR